MLNRGQQMGLLPDIEQLFGFLTRFERVGIAVSGGGDSIALMLMVAEWAKGRQAAPELFVYTVDHGLRLQAAQEAAFVVVQAEKLGLGVRSLRWEDSKPETGVPAAARRARYRLIGEAMRQDGAEVLLTAHHAHDQAETVLMRLAHGSGLGGLGAMSHYSTVEGVKVCHPLLDIRPDVLAAAVVSAGVEPAIDPSNVDRTYERVRWRQILPVLEGLGLDAARFSLFTRRARRADDALQAIADQGFADLAQIDAFGAVHIQKDKLTALAEELQVRIVRMSLQIAGASQKPFALQPVEALVERFGGPDKLNTQTLLGCVIGESGANLSFMRECARVSQVPVLVAPGSKVIWDDRFEIFNTGEDEVEISSGQSVTRQQLEGLLSGPFEGIMLAVHGAPVVRLGGQVLAVGAKILNKVIVARILGVERN